MGILSGMLLAAGVAFFSKKKLSAQKKEDDAKKEVLPTLEHAKEDLNSSSTSIKTENDSLPGETKK